jgi:FAD/FMN-containing dehydrogenase
LAAKKKVLTVGVMLDDMNKVLEVNSKAHTLRVQGQILYKDVYEAATAAGLSVKGGSVGFWQGLTIAGSIAAGTHGTGLGMESNVVSGNEETTWQCVSCTQ